MFAESRLLFKLWLKNPRKIGAVAVSSSELAAAMARQVPRGPGWVVELGGGTGSVTKALLKAGTHPEKLIVVERDPTLHKVLQERYPGVKVLLGDAGRLQALLKREGIDHVKAIVSSLPLLTMKRSTQYRITSQAFNVLQPGAPLIQFTYSLFSPIPRRRHGVHGEVGDRVLQNLPPASVWVYRKPHTHTRRAAE
ncbi:MAG TPA: methyltransferase domain-containing protein [Dongiaceae bacterium]|jgi:phosphatidylethanolamine/phosphatidyl-N-methylethanolamine N-methyltransferase|nr:methyltransferase domain-containing protein [Dongiaceae bacterium]